MHIYSVHRRPDGRDADEGIVLVKEGFCWPAFLFTFLWALWHRMWAVAAILIVAGLAASAAAGWLAPAAAPAAGLGYLLLIGYGANDWRRSSMARRGYRFAGLVGAADADAAAQRYFDRIFDSGDRARAGMRGATPS